MAIIIREYQQHVSIPAAMLFKMTNPETEVVPQYLSQYVKSVETLQGSGAPGTIRKVTFTDGEHKYVNISLDAMDPDNNTVACTFIGGEPWIEAIDKVCFELKIVPSSDKECIFHIVNKFYPKVGSNNIDEAQIKVLDEHLAGLAKMFEAHVLANPNN